MDLNTSTKEPSEPLYEASPAIIGILAFSYGSISLLALVGNSLVFLIIVGNKRMHSVTNFLLANLASADILIAAAAVPFQFQAALLQRWVLPDFMCIVAPFVQILSVNVSIFTLTVISIERYRALLYPFKSRITKSVAGYAIAIIWFLAVLCAAPVAAAMNVELFEDASNGGLKPFCFPTGFATPVNESVQAKEEAIQQSTKIYNHYVVFLVAIQFFIPLLIISFAYMTIVLHLWGSQEPGEMCNDVNSVRIKQRRKVVKMLIMVVSLFSLCWLPLQTYNFLTAVAPQINEYPYINIIWFCCNFLAMSNSCQNPFILGFCNEKFRRELRLRFKFCFCLGRRLTLRRGTEGRTLREDSAVINGNRNGDLRRGMSEIERLPRSAKRCANYERTPDDSPVYVSTRWSTFRQKRDQFDCYD